MTDLPTTLARAEAYLSETPDASLRLLEGPVPRVCPSTLTKTYRRPVEGVTERFMTRAEWTRHYLRIKVEWVRLGVQAKKQGADTLFAELAAKELEDWIKGVTE